MAHHSRHQASRRVTPKREDNQRADAMARWLRAGAVAAGMGAAMAMGAGVASADTDGSDTSTSAGSESSSAGPSASNVSAAVGSDQSNDTAGPDADAKPAKVSTRPGTPRIRTSVSAQGTVRTPSNRDKPEAEPPTPDTATNSAAEVDATADESAQPADQVATPDGVDADLIDEIAVDEVSEGPREPSATKSNRSPAASSIRAEITAVARNITAAARKATADVVSGPVNESASTSITETARDAMAPASSLSAAAVTAEPTTTATAAQTEPAYPAAITAPVTLRAMVSDVLRWLGLPALSVGSPIPPIAVPAPLDKVWIALRRFEYRFFNDYPTAQPGQTSQSTTDTGVVTGSLNATDPDGDQISYTVVAAPSKGTVVINADGTYVYTPDPAFAHIGGTDSFSVLVDDSAGNPPHVHGLAGRLGLTNPQTVTVNVTVGPIVNAGPSAPAVIEAPAPNSTGVVTGTIGGVDPNGDTLSYTVTTGPTRGTVIVDSDGTYRYSPAASAQHAASAEDAAAAAQVDSFTVTISDGYGGTALTTVSVVIKPVNTIPTVDPTITMHDNSEIIIAHKVNSDGSVWTTYATISVFKITALTFDADGDDVVVSVSNGDPAVGSIQALADGTYRYVPAAASMGTLGVITDTVTITVTDGHGGIHTRTETVTLQSQWRATATGIPVTTIVGSGATAPNPAGGNYDLGGGLVIGGGSYGLGLDESGTNIVVTGPYTSPIFLPVVTEDGDVPWSVSETETTTSIFANGRLAVFLYLGEA